MENKNFRTWLNETFTVKSVFPTTYQYKNTNDKTTLTNIDVVTKYAKLNNI